MSAVTKKKCEEYKDLRSVETVGEEFIEAACARYEDIDRSKIIGFIKHIQDNGSGAIVITEDKVYSGISDKVEILLDGLMHISKPDDVYTYAIYENNYVKKSKRDR